MLGPACLECIRVGVGEVSRICFAGWCGDCDPMRVRLAGACGGGAGLSVTGGGGGVVAARVSSPIFLRAVCSSSRSPPFSSVRHLMVSLISVTVAAKAATSPLLSSTDVRSSSWAGRVAASRRCHRRAA
jgi:hypothetical protein